MQMTKHKNILSILLCSILIIFAMTACTRQENQPEKKPQKPLPKVVQPSDMEPTPTPQPTPETDPQGTAQDDTTSDLSSFKTVILDQSEGRMHNLQLASSKINNYTLQPGEVFSFNNVVGPAEEENGFQKATVLQQKQPVLGEGGGVCQVSSTLFNAAQQAGLEIVERHSHSRNVGYIPQGQDAAIAYGAEDLKFKNNKGYAIKINAWVEGGYMRVTISKAR